MATKASLMKLGLPGVYSKLLGERYNLSKLKTEGGIDTARISDICYVNRDEAKLILDVIQGKKEMVQKILSRQKCATGRGRLPELECPK